MSKTTSFKNNFNAGELSPRAFGRFDPDSPLFRNGLDTQENFLGSQLGGVFYRPGTVYVGTIKDQTAKVKFLKFDFSTTQTYILEMGNLYMRFWANKAQVLSGGNPLEIATVYKTADVFAIKTAQRQDVMYLVHPLYKPQKLIRNSATSFTISAAPIIRGPFLDDNTGSTTITASADTGTGITLTASAALFFSTHVGALWRVKSGVVKITVYTSATVVTGDVQAEPSGAAGNLATAAAAVTDWAEGAFSDYRGWPAAVTFHAGRLYYSGTTNDPQTLFGSSIRAFDNFSKGTALDTDAVKFTIDSENELDVRWLKTTSKQLKIGSTGGTVSALNGASGVPITAANPPQIAIDTDYAVANLPPHQLGGYLYYLQNNLFQLRELIYNITVDREESNDMNIFADHVLRDGSGAVDLERQASPSDRIWIVRSDGQIAVLTRNTQEKVLGWCRIIMGTDSTSAGVVETIQIVQQEADDDVVWVVVKRTINGVVKRYVEYFSSEFFTNVWDPILVDASLTLDSPVVISNATKASPVVITATAHGFSNGDQVRIDKVVGMTDVNGKIFIVQGVTANTFKLTDESAVNIDGTAYGTYQSGGQVRKMVTVISGLGHLTGETVTVQTDGGIPSATQTYLVTAGSITLAHKAAVSHIGLPYTGTLKFLPINDGGQTKNRRIYLTTLRLYKSLGYKIGQSLSKLQKVWFGKPGDPLGGSPILFTGDKDCTPDTWFDRDVRLIIQQSQPIPLFITAAVMRSDVEEK